ncbi:hypothetical protein MPER_02126 [Moniliophthora perniciosa FA553]|nr:hypothetical protein MPER_02126 [Moniliophthora perniciosa FA553]
MIITQCTLDVVFVSAICRERAICPKPIHARTRFVHQILIANVSQDLQATGKSIMRPLYYDFSLSGSFVANVTRFNVPAVIHQFMLGNYKFSFVSFTSAHSEDIGQQLLIAPVGEAGVTAKEVYLPVLGDNIGISGATWKHWWTDEDFGSGGNFVNISAPLDAIPVFYLGSKDDILSGSV